MFDKQVDNARPNLSMGNIEKFLIPLPPLSEQHSIVAKVQQLLQMVNELEKQVQLSQTQAQQLLQAVLKEAFSSKAKVYEENELITMAAES
jgi:type I restriction enzyme S subunit